MLVIGLTGGIASGKSMVSDIFKSCRAKVVDADEIVKGLYKKKAVRRILAKNFGNGVLKCNGCVDRGSLAKIVFGSKKKLSRINALIHPLVISETKKAIVRFKKKKARLALVVAPLLFEAKMQRLFDAIVVVKCPRAQQIKRLVKCRGVSVSFAKKAISAQLPLRNKLKFADYVIDSSGPKQSARREARALCKKLMKMAVDE